MSIKWIIEYLSLCRESFKVREEVNKFYANIVRDHLHSFHGCCFKSKLFLDPLEKPFATPIAKHRPINLRLSRNEQDNRFYVLV